MRLRNLRCEVAKVLTRTVEPLMMTVVVVMMMMYSVVNDLGFGIRSVRGSHYLKLKKRKEYCFYFPYFIYYWVVMYLFAVVVLIVSHFLFAWIEVCF
jgi:uncharacterized membrane protein